MTTLTESIVVTELTVEDRIQRVLDRLESGEKLGYGLFYDGFKFCVLGMFMDESGLDEWRPGGYYPYTYLDPDPIHSIGLIVDFYALNHMGKINTLKLSDDIIDEIHGLLGKNYKITDLADMNNNLVKYNVDNTKATSILAEVIKSGAVFRD